MKSNIFREYDIRGIFGEDYSYEDAYIIGRSFGSYISLKGETWTVVAYDNRISSPEISSNLIRGIIDSGINVYNAGLVTTPMCYFYRKYLDLNTGIMVTASHNPKEYNGFKIAFFKNGNAYGKYIKDFKEYTYKGNFKSGKGIIKNIDLRKEYIDLLINSINLGQRKIKVVFDCGNGTGSVIIKDILQNIDNLQYDLLYCDSDGNFPNHHPDPSLHKNLVDLANRVKELNYDLGIAFDGDADRVGIVDENGNPIYADSYMIIMYRYLNNNLKVRKALFDVKCSKSLVDEVKKLGLEPIMNRTGHSYANLKMIEEKLDFGGEYSGHLFFTDKFMGFDDGIYAGLRMLEILSNTDKSMSSLLEGINKYFSTEEIKFTVGDNEKYKIVEKVRKYCDNKGYEYISVDGVRVEFNDSWALIRVSNTTPCITTRFEATTKTRLEEIQKEFTDLIKKLL